MKAVYMILSGLILSLGVTVAMAGLLSISSLTKSNTKNNTEKQEQFTGMWVTKEGHVRKDLLPDGRYDITLENTAGAYKDCYAVNSSHIEYKEVNNKKGQSN